MRRIFALQAGLIDPIVGKPKYYLYICIIIICIEKDVFLQIMSKKTTSIIGVETDLIPVRKSSLKRLDADILVKRKLYVTTFNNEQFYILLDDNNVKSTPGKYKELELLKYFGRISLLEQGVYFVISGKYVFLPSLIANSRVKKKSNNSTKLSSVGQSIILFYLLGNNEDFFTIYKLQDKLPYNHFSYITWNNIT